MKRNKEVRVVSADGKIVQSTIFDERWYDKNVNGVHTFVPSVTWITSYSHKGIGLEKWRANHGWDESQELLREAGDRGYLVHSLITKILGGGEISIDEQVINQNSGILEPIDLHVYESVMSFVSWFSEVKPKVLGNEVVVFNDTYGYAGTADLICEIDGKRTLIDLKTSQNVWLSHKLQLSAYKHCLEGIENMGVLQIGYLKNDRRWKYTEVPDKFELFLAVKQSWQEENMNTKVKKRDYPTKLKLNL